MTLRSLEVLRAVPLVAAEDTRITRRLFARYEITTHLVPHHARNEAATTPALLAHLRAGRDLALVTDAGTPLVSDPGAGLVAAWAARGGTRHPDPGRRPPSSPPWSRRGSRDRAGASRDSCRGAGASAANGSRGWPRTNEPPSSSRRPGASPPRSRDLAAACGDARPAAVCRELTKLHEETVRGSLGALAAAAAAGAIDRRGEVGRRDRRAPARPAGARRSTRPDAGSPRRPIGGRSPGRRAVRPFAAGAPRARVAPTRWPRPAPRSPASSPTALPAATPRAGWPRPPGCRDGASTTRPTPAPPEGLRVAGLETRRRSSSSSASPARAAGSTPERVGLDGQRVRRAVLLAPARARLDRRGDRGYLAVGRLRSNNEALAAPEDAAQPHIRDLSTSTSQPGEDGSKPCSTSQRIASRLRSDHHPRITSRSTSVP